MVSISEIIAPPFYEAHRDLKENKYTHYWFPGGRASCKSSFVGIELPFRIMHDATKGIMSNAVVMRKVANTLYDSVYNQLLWGLEKLGVQQYWKVSKAPMEMTYLPTGQKIIFRGADDPLKLKSTKFRIGYCKYLWYEEASEFFGMEEIRNINQTFMRGGDNFAVFYTYNPPKSVNNWVNTEVLIERPDKKVIKSTYLEVPKEWLGEQFFIEAEHLKKTNELAYRNEYLGEATGTGGAVFTNITIRHITDEEIKHFANIRDGVDFGYAVDPVAYGQCNFDKTRKKLYIFNEVYKVNMSNKKLHEAILQIKLGNAPITADSAEPKSIDELNSYGGIRVKGAKKGPDSVEYGIKYLQDLEEIIIDNVRCPNTAREFTTYEYEKDKYGIFKSKFPDADNHTIDMIRYALEDDMLLNRMTFGYRKIV
jgi:PBSX family phage terminase large subunit